MTTRIINCIIITREEVSNMCDNVYKFNVGERLKLVRKHYHLSQPKFGEKLGVSRDVISNVEQGRVPLKPLLAELICSTFNVDMVWLNEGTGEMLIETDLSIYEDLRKEFSLNETDLKIIRGILSLSSEQREKVADVIRMLANTLNEGTE